MEEVPWRRYHGGGIIDEVKSTSEKGQANGYTPLNSSTKVDVQYLPDALVGAVIYKGTWDAGTNTPTLPTPAPANQGFYYVVSAPGTYLGITYGIGDWAISNGTAWEKVDNTQSVTSVNGLTGAVSLTTSNINEGTNLYYTEAVSYTHLTLPTILLV